MQDIILVLGGGGARGLAHLGVLQILKCEGIPVSAVAGTSMGGLLGALYCAGVPLDEIESEILRLAQPEELLKLVDLRVTASGISIKGARIYEFLTATLGGEIRFEALQIPLAVVAVDVWSGRPVVLNEGSVPAAVRATISIPEVFEPVERDRMRLVDGGILNNVPVDVARTLGSGPVIAVDVMPRFRDNEPGADPVSLPPEIPHLPRVLEDAGHITWIMMAELTEMRLEASPPDLVLRPELPTAVSTLMGFGRARDILEAGRQAAKAAMPQLQALAQR